MTAPGFRAHLLRETPGTHAQIHFTGLPQEAYERIRTRALESDERPHDEPCDCVAHPWPTWGGPEATSEEPEITDRRGEEVAGTARAAFGRAEVTLFEEPIAPHETRQPPPMAPMGPPALTYRLLKLAFRVALRVES